MQTLKQEVVNADMSDPFIFHEHFTAQYNTLALEIFIIPFHAESPVRKLQGLTRGCNIEHSNLQCTHIYSTLVCYAHVSVLQSVLSYTYCSASNIYCLVRL